MNYQAEINIEGINRFMPKTSDKIFYLKLIHQDFRNMLAILEEGILNTDFSIFRDVRHCLVPFLRQLKVHSLADQFEYIGDDNWLIEVQFLKHNINAFVVDLKYVTRNLEMN